MSSTNPFDQTRIRDDVVRYEYAERLFEILRAKHKERLEAAKIAALSDREYDREDDWLDGLQIAMNILDEEMGRLRAAWG